MNHETLAAYALGAIAKGWTPSREDLELFAASDVSDPRDAMQIGAIHAIEKAFKWVHEKNLAKLGYVRVPGATGTKPAKGGGNLVLARKGSELREKAEKLGLNKKVEAEAVADKPVGPSPSDLRSELKAKLAESDSRVEAETKRLSREKSKARGARKDEIEWRAMKDRESELRSKLLDEFHKKYAEHPDVIAEKKKTSEMAKRMQSEASEAEARDKGIEDKRDWDAIQERGGVDSVKAGLAKELVKAKANLARAASRNKWKYEGPVERVQRNIDRVDYLADKYGKAEPKPAAQLRTEDKPKEMPPEEKEIADAVAEHKGKPVRQVTASMNRMSKLAAAQKQADQLSKPYAFTNKKLPRVDTASLVREIDDVRYAFVDLAKDTGVAACRSFIVTLQDAERGKISGKYSDDTRDHAVSRTRAAVNHVLDPLRDREGESPASATAMSEMHSVERHGDKKRDVGDVYRTGRAVHLTAAGGATAKVDAKYHAAIMQRHKSAVPHIAAEGEPIVYRVDGALVGVVMPFGGPQ